MKIETRIKSRKLMGVVIKGRMYLNRVPTGHAWLVGPDGTINYGGGENLEKKLAQAGAHPIYEGDSVTLTF